MIESERRKYHQEWYKQNKDRILNLQRTRYANLRNKFLDMYGRECSCCGETSIEFLTIEHIQGQKGCPSTSVGDKAYFVATKEYRPDLFKVLCMNCNHSFGRYGYCPHNPSVLSHYEPIRKYNEKKREIDERL